MELLLERVADAFDALEIILPRPRHDVAGELHDGLRSHAVSPDFKRVLTFQFQEQSDVFERFGEGFTGHDEVLS